ncbi:unnamed protein product, partial [Rotaria socialis]
MRKGRRDSSFDDNYYIFIRCLLKERVPSVLVITCCEMESPMSSWIDKAQNKRAFEGYNFRKVVCGTALQEDFEGGLFAKKLDETRKSLWQAIENSQCGDLVPLLTEEVFSCKNLIENLTGHEIASDDIDKIRSYAAEVSTQASLPFQQEENGNIKIE